MQTKEPAELDTPIARSARCRLLEGLESIKDWTKGDAQLFYASFATTKKAGQIAAELGMSNEEFEFKKRAILRRFMVPKSEIGRLP